MNKARDSFSGGISLFWAMLLSLAWLMPNHFPPWVSFHADAWFSIVSISAAMVLFALGKNKAQVHGLVIVFLLAALLPWIQFAYGLIAFAGKAWLSSLYLVGFAIAMLLGARWSALNGEQPLNALFFSILLAAIGSCGLVLGTWFGVINADLSASISMGHSGERFYANLAQPNLLATFLLWGCFSGLWFYIDKKISVATVLSLIFIFELCISLTGSRQAYVGLMLVIIVMWAYRKSWTQSKVLLIATICPIIVVLGPKFWSLLHGVVFPSEVTLNLERPIAVDDVRLQAWRIFFHAAMEKPWFGYGWSEVTPAQIAVAKDFPSMGGLFGHTHNVMLDFVVWIGFPLAIFMLSVLIVWAVTCLARIKSEKDVVIFLVLCVFGIHAMLELPHQYAIFLFPVGIFMGVLNHRLNLFPLFFVSKWIVLLLILTVSLLLAGVVRDYLHVEQSYNRFRFERKGVKNPESVVKRIPDTLILTQFEHWFASVAYPERGRKSDEQLRLQTQAVMIFPASGAMFELGKNLVEAGRIEEAQFWFDTICKVSSDEECRHLQSIWKELQKTNEEYRAIYWN
jgi:O-antigen ligase